MATLDNNKESAITLKEKGNKLFREKKWQEAYQMYSRAIELDDANVIYYTNRAATLMEMKRFLMDPLPLLALR